MVKALQVPQRKVYNMYNIYNIVSELDIQNGSTKRMNCPNCGGYKTFTVTNNMGSLVWNCYKASCSVRGGERVRLSVDDIRSGFTGAEKYAEDDFTMPNYVVPHHNQYHFIKWCATWHLDEEELGLLYDVKEDRVVFPIVHEGKVVDATGRSLGSRLPKWKRYGNSGLPYAHGCGNVAIVVEDCVSAAVVGCGFLVGVAVLGTSLAETHKRYLSQFSTAVIALDPDALPKTLAMAKELRGYVNDVQVLRLNDDLKYRNEEDLANLTSLAKKGE